MLCGPIVDYDQPTVRPLGKGWYDARTRDPDDHPDDEDDDEDDD